MPEPSTATDGEASVQTIPAPQSADKPETTTQSEGLSDANSVMDMLDIPEELRATVAPKSSEEPEAKIETPEPEVKTEDETPEVDDKKKKEEQKPEEDSEEDEAEGEEEEEKEEKPPEQKIDKRQKRINRLTRQRSELEKQLDERDSKLEELEAKLQRFEKNGSAPEATIPQVGPWMPDKETAETYSDLSAKKKTAEATLAWCDKYTEGVNVTENGQQRFVAPEEILAARRKAEMDLMEINPEIKVLEREAKTTFRQQKAEFDKATYHFWPEFQDKRSPEYQELQSISREFPTIAATPAGQYYIGLAIEGRKSLEAKLAAAKNGNGNGSPQKRKDIDPKVFTTPRVPIAPHTAEPPTRESVPSSQKRMKEANDSLLNDPDGSAESLARVFQAREEVTNNRPSSRSPVRS